MSAAAPIAATAATPAAPASSSFRVREGVTFLEMCRDVDRAVEVSLQPIELVGSEAVILFSDIFVPIPGMGVEVLIPDFNGEDGPLRTVMEAGPAAASAPDWIWTFTFSWWIVGFSRVQSIMVILVAPG